MLGDRTAAYEGRLTLNPLKHLDPLGSVVLPLLTYLAGGFIFGWAKPVPFNPYNLKNQKWGEGIVAAAGPFANLLLALAFGVIIRFGVASNALSTSFIEIASLVVIFNLGLLIFNLLPIPPLDGSKILFTFLPQRSRIMLRALERYSFIFIIIFILFFAGIISPILYYLFTFITGLS